MSLEIYVGDVGEYLCARARSHDAGARLATVENFQQCDRGICYTSLGDFAGRADLFFACLDRADLIHYAPPEIWSDGRSVNPHDIHDSVQGYTEFILAQFRRQKNNVRGITSRSSAPIAWLTPPGQRASHGAQIWIAGCSISHGVGVTTNERYGELVANALKMPVTWLTQPGSSITSAVWQIMKSDIGPDDVVLLGVTNEHRFQYQTQQGNDCHLRANYHLEDQWQQTSLTPKIITALLCDDVNMRYQAVTSLRACANFCQHVGARLLMIGLCCSPSLVMMLDDLREFHYFQLLDSGNNTLDLGTDQEHPGPKTHQAYSTFCLRHLKTLYQIH